MKPLAGHRIVSTFSFLLLVATFLLLLLVGLSLPILKSVYVLSVKATPSNQPQSSVATQLKFGVWGFCASRSVYQSSTFKAAHSTATVGYRVLRHAMGLSWDMISLPT
jgi:hypothetical protein